MELNVNLRFPELAQLLPLLQQLGATFLALQRDLATSIAAQAANHKESITFMSKVSIQLDALDKATSGIAKVLSDLRDKAVNGMTVEETARFDAQISTLNSMGTDPENPV